MVHLKNTKERSTNFSHSDYHHNEPNHTRGVLPEEMEKSNPDSLQTRGTTTEKSHFRGISMMISTSKIVAIILNQQLLLHMMTERLILKTQYAYQPRKSTIGALIHLMMELHKGRKQNIYQVIVTYDLSTCFPLLDIPILLERLRIISANQRTINLFYSYLTEKSIQTRIDGKLSSEMKSSIGGWEKSCLTSILLLLMVSYTELFNE